MTFAERWEAFWQRRADSGWQRGEKKRQEMEEEKKRYLDVCARCGRYRRTHDPMWGSCRRFKERDA